MFAKRIIPCLDCKDGRVVKGIHFVNLRDAGDPGDLAEMYNREGADELVMLDISASREGRTTLMETVRRVARRLFIPLTVGGGVRVLDDAQRLLSAGADKVGINTAAVETPEVVRVIAENYGRQAIVVAIDARRIRNSSACLARRRTASLGSCDPRWHQTHGPRRARMGAARGRVGRGRNPADFHGRGRHASGFRLRVDRHRWRAPCTSRSSPRAAPETRNILRKFSSAVARRRIGCVNLSLRDAHHPQLKRVPAHARRAG